MKTSKILIIDDEQAIFQLIADILEVSGNYRCFHAKNGEEGLEQAQELDPDLIFLDLMMPVLDGVSFLQSLGQQNVRSCPVIAITGQHDADILHKCYHLGVVALIRKPLEVWEIAAIAHRYTKFSENNQDRFGEKKDGHVLLTEGALGTIIDGGGRGEDFLEAITLPVFVKNKECDFVFINSAFTDVTGLSVEDVIGKKATDIEKLSFFAGNDQEQQLLALGGRYSSEEYLEDGNGWQRAYICHSSAVTVNEGEDIAGIVGVFVETGELASSKFKKKLTLLYPELSPRECDVASLVRVGLANKEVAERLGVALSTVEFHRNNLREKLGIKGNRISLVNALLSM